MVRSCRYASVFATAATVAIAALTLATPVTARADGGLKLPAGASGWNVAPAGQAWPLTLRFSAVLVELQPRSPIDTALAWPNTRASRGMSLLGDYYFYATADESASWRSGLRATGGLLLRSPGLAYTDLTLSARGLQDLTGSALPGARTLDGYGPKPYLGLGYSGLLARSGLGFWVDVGVLVQSPGSAVGLGRAFSGTHGAYDLLRDLQLAPMLQLGVNYAF